jgi:predicted esterase
MKLETTLVALAAAALFALGACSDDGNETPQDGSVTGDTIVTSDSTKPHTDGTPATDGPPQPDLGTLKPCGLTIGENGGAVGNHQDFLINGDKRTFIVQKVNVPAGNTKKLPIIFGYHGTGSYYNIPTKYYSPVSESRPFIYVVPKGSGTFNNPYDFSIDPTKNKDIKLFDDLIKCVAAQLPVDMNRIHAFGFSWGGHWINHLLAYRGNMLASAAQLSSGAIGPKGASYEAMLAKFAHKPAQLVIWGGITDTYSGYSFDKSSKDTVASFRKVGLFTVQCIHSDGHDITPPKSMNKFIFEFFQDHPKGVPSPYKVKWPPPMPFTKGTYLTFPDYCAIAP